MATTSETERVPLYLKHLRRQDDLIREAQVWFNRLVYGHDCYDPERWAGHPRCHERERGLSYARLLRLERAFTQAWKVHPDPAIGTD